ncbi:ABC transporter substrate-binding protein [Vibrio paucivorans]
MKLLSLDWSSQQVLTKVLGNLLTEVEVPVEYVYTDADSQWYKLAQSQGDVQVEVWEGSMAAKFQQLLASDSIREGGTHLAKTREDWWYPDYVEPLCPGLPNWRALKHCSKIFAEQGELGVYYSGPWEKPDAARIRALEIPYEIRVLKDGDEINQKIEEHLSTQKPLLIFNWSPNWVEAKYQGKFVEFPKYDPACENDAAWGVNPKFNWDCGNPVGGWLKIATSKRLNLLSPCAWDVVHSFSLNNHQIALAAALVDDQKLSVDDAAAQWLERNQLHIAHWISHDSCM